MNARIIRGSKGRDSRLLIHEGFRYQLNRTRPTRMYWRCWQKNCRSSLSTNVIDLQNPNPAIQVITNNDAHMHLNEMDKIGEMDSMNNMREQVRANPTMPIKRIYDHTVATAHQNAGAGAPVPLIPDYSQVKSSLYREKASQCPPIPHNIQQMQINGLFAQTFLGERYLLHLDNGIGVAIFATDFELRHLGNAQTLYIDGTFKTAPKPYMQVFTIHCEFMDRVVPLTASLLTGKTQQHYDCVMNVILQEVRRVTGNNGVNVVTVVSDFEQAVFNAVRAAFPKLPL